jgi:hypothetical protein
MSFNVIVFGTTTPLVKWRCLLFLGSLRNEIAALSATFQTRTSSMEPLKKLRRLQRQSGKSLLWLLGFQLILTYIILPSVPLQLSRQKLLLYDAILLKELHWK